MKYKKNEIMTKEQVKDNKLQCKGIHIANEINDVLKKYYLPSCEIYADGTDDYGDDSWDGEIKINLSLYIKKNELK